jgi:hypothetical protein
VTLATPQFPAPDDAQPDHVSSMANTLLSTRPREEDVANDVFGHVGGHPAETS